MRIVRWLQSACQTLSQTPAEVMRTLSLSFPRASAPAAEGALPRLCRQLAEEYRLDQTTRLEDGWWVVRFSRRPPGSDSGGAALTGLTS